MTRKIDERAVQGTRRLCVAELDEVTAGKNKGGGGGNDTANTSSPSARRVRDLFSGGGYRRARIWVY